MPNLRPRQEDEPVLEQLNISYANQTKGKSYSDEEDRFLLVQLSKHGYGVDDVYERIKREICEWPAFRFDWYVTLHQTDKVCDAATQVYQIEDGSRAGSTLSDACWTSLERERGRKTCQI